MKKWSLEKWRISDIQDKMTENETNQNGDAAVPEKRPAQEPPTTTNQGNAPAPQILKTQGRVCITYGRDKIMNKQVVSLIRELGIDPLVMQDKDNASKPLADFVHEYPDVSFIIAILSADDWVYPKQGKPKDALMRADQRVVFHLGYWIGKLGRERVYALYYDQRTFRWPTEYFDVIYTPLDREGLWKGELVRRLERSSIVLKKTNNL